MRSRLGDPGRGIAAATRSARRIVAAALLFATLPVLALPLPRRSDAQRFYCRALLGSLGIRFILTGSPVRDPRGMLVVSNHVSWADIFAVGAVLPGSFVARADVIDWPGVGLAARMANVIPIERRSLRQLPMVVDTVVDRLRDGHTVVAFPEGTTYCGVDHGEFRPALFQAAVEAVRPVQPLRLSYHHEDGSPSSVAAFLGDDSLWASIKRIARARVTTVHVQVLPLQLPGSGRGGLSAECQMAVHSGELTA